MSGFPSLKVACAVLDLWESAPIFTRASILGLELPLRTDGKRKCDNTSSDHHRDALHDARLCPDTTRLDACSTCSVELHGL